MELQALREAAFDRPLPLTELDVDPVTRCRPRPLLRGLLMGDANVNVNVTTTTTAEFHRGWMDGRYEEWTDE